MMITKNEAKALLDDYVVAIRNGWVPSVECALREAAPDLARAFIASEEAREKLEERVRVLEEATDMAINRLEVRCDEAWSGDARDFKRSIIGIFAEYRAALIQKEEICVNDS